ncbi:YciI family protein [Pyxidicoccus xibeiensis]|uniref:YciI family protein n=1 Tax=Pyxidicoccus xibeiensis TaxID=2906759 RepID=UPI0020A7BFEF|nr:YciI family protein [Pyxidicoccus xibeiensis]MCP3144431.1 YciI family protein [Pyxidicoccus xibeiensis]
MDYMLLVIENAAERRARSVDVGYGLMERMNRFNEDLKARGICKASDSLGPDARGVRIEARGGKPVVSDGPFTEAKEIVGGFFLLSCESREQALAIARECPAAEWATVELREVGPCHGG